MLSLLRLLCSLAAMLYLANHTSLLAETPPVEKKAEAKKSAVSKFMRIQRDRNKQPLSLETATVRYAPANGDGGLVVDLIGVVHIGDRAYYQALNKQMEQYDVLLYELVAPPGTRIPKGGKRQMDNPVAMLQQMMKLVLDLESQTEHIDYTKKNFVHADLSPQEMAEAMRKRGDDGLTVALSVVADMLRQQNLQQMKQEENPGRQEEEVDLLSLLLDADGPVRMKRMLAQQFEQMESGQFGLGPTLNTLLVADRNEAAMKVFQKELAKGKKRIAIFYGAAHMPDFEKRLREDFGLKPVRTEWQTAWDLRPKKKGIDDVFRLFKD